MAIPVGLIMQGVGLARGLMGGGGPSISTVMHLEMIRQLSEIGQTLSVIAGTLYKIEDILSTQDERTAKYSSRKEVHKKLLSYRAFLDELAPEKAAITKIENIANLLDQAAALREEFEELVIEISGVLSTSRDTKFSLFDLSYSILVATSVYRQLLIFTFIPETLIEHANKDRHLVQAPHSFDGSESKIPSNKYSAKITLLTRFVSTILDDFYPEFQREWDAEIERLTGTPRGSDPTKYEIFALGLEQNHVHWRYQSPTNSTFGSSLSGNFRFSRRYGIRKIYTLAEDLVVEEVVTQITKDDHLGGGQKSTRKEKVKFKDGPHIYKLHKRRANLSFRTWLRSKEMKTAAAAKDFDNYQETFLENLAAVQNGDSETFTQASEKIEQLLHMRVHMTEFAGALAALRDDLVGSPAVSSIESGGSEDV